MTEHIIALDPAHGGRDTGDIGFIAEKTICEGIMKYLNEYLKTDANYFLLLTRPIDLQQYEGIVSIKDRANSANKLKAELLISIHANLSTLVEPIGIVCYPKVPKTLLHEESILLARYIVNEIEDMQPETRGIHGIRYRYYNSEAFAEFNDTNPYNDDTYYGIIRIPTCPAVLVELCYVLSSYPLQSCHFGQSSNTQPWVEMGRHSNVQEGESIYSKHWIYRRLALQRMEWSPSTDRWCVPHYCRKEQESLTNCSARNQGHLQTDSEELFRYPNQTREGCARCGYW